MPQSRCAYVLSVAAILTATLCASAAQGEDREVLPKTVTPEHYRIAITPDAKTLAFAGTLSIDVTVHASTRQITFNCADIVIDGASVSAQTATVSYNPEHQTATLSVAHALKPGPATLKLTYHGKISQQPAGLFALDYDTPHGTARALFTQFEISDARRFVPSWDEPAAKATFQLDATVPANLMPVSNMPIVDSEALAGGFKRVHFAATPVMSSYLLFFGLGDFERIHRAVGTVDVGVIVKRGDTAKAGYALDIASRILPYYEEYFGVPYPLPKLDLVAAPGESQTFGAMENWGAIMSFDSLLLIDSKFSSQRDLRNVFDVTAHEMAHQWFGDLVTMQWWNDIWLNEGFASWMATKASDKFHPEWQPWLSDLNARSYAMQPDSRMGTHPIVQPIRDAQQAALAFDEITYEKGSAVIRMIEDYVGESEFRDGVRIYIKAHEHGNTVSDDLWHALEKSSNVPVTDIAHDFTLQAGVPLIRAAAQGAHLHLTQERFAYDESGIPARWRVPVVADVGQAWRGIVSRDQPRDIDNPDAKLAIVNAGQAGYFRTLYDTEGMARIIPAFPTLSPADQLGLLSDTRAMGYAGLEPFSDFLEIVARCKPDMNPLVLIDAAERLGAINTMYDGLPDQPRFQAFARGVLNPILASLGWTVRPGEPENDLLLRRTVIVNLGEFGDAAVIAEARARFAGYVRDPATLQADLRRNVLSIVAGHADTASWEQLHALARSAVSETEKSDLYTLLGTAHDAALAQRARELSLSDEAPVTTRPSIVAATSGYFPRPAFDFVIAHQAVFEKWLEPSARSRYVPSLLSNSHDVADLPALAAFADAHIPQTERGDTVKVQASIRYSAKIRAERLPEVDRWLGARGY
jgi:aminopeptidase N